MYASLVEHVGTGRMIRLKRGLPSEPSMHGYLVGLGTHLGLMHCFDDFEPDGYTVFRLEDVLAIERTPHEEHWDQMLRGEGLLDGVKAPVEVDLSSFDAALRSILPRFPDVIVECEEEAEEESEFFLGRMIDASNREVVLHYVTALGRWLESPSHIPLEAITKVQFDTPYLRRFMRYTEPFPMH
jgi:hypothetical protein